MESIPIKELRKLGFEVEVLVIDGGSQDNTVELAKKAGARIIDSPKGYGRQYKEGLKKAKGEIIITGDSDGTYPFEEIPYYLKIFENDKLDFATVNRFAKMNKGSMKTANKVGLPVMFDPHQMTVQSHAEHTSH
jgi:glycosyltransferase involved in cell wall biosynthesis